MMSTNVDISFAEGFAYRLKAERRRLGMTQADFGALGSVRRATQYLYERGERLPTADYLAGISRAGADLVYLVSGVLPSESSSDICLDPDVLEKVLRVADAWCRDDRGRLLDLEHRITLTVALCRCVTNTPKHEIDWDEVQRCIATAS